MAFNSVSLKGSLFPPLNKIPPETQEFAWQTCLYRITKVKKSYHKVIGSGNKRVSNENVTQSEHLIPVTDAISIVGLSIVGLTHGRLSMQITSDLSSEWAGSLCSFPLLSRLFGDFNVV